MPAVDFDTIVLEVVAAGTAETAAKLDTVAAAETRVGLAAETMGVKTEASGRRSGFLLNQLLFTARRFAYGFTLAMAAAGAGLVGLGFQYDNAMQQGQIAFTALLGSSSLAKQEISSLFDLAAKTPFTFQNVLSTTRQLLAFGFSLKETNKMLPILGDTISAFGLSGDQISHLAVVFGQIHQSGRLLGQDMRQLEQAGVPVFSALRHQLHLTQAQIAQFMKGQLVIPSNVGIAAIMDELNNRFHGMAAKQAKTFQGELSTLHDYASQFMGGILQGVFTGTTTFMDRINNSLEGIRKTFTETGSVTWGTVAYIDKLIGAGGMLSFALRQLKTFFENLWTFLSNNVWPTLKYGIGLFVIMFSILLWAINTVLGPFAKNIHVLRFVIEGWITLLILQAFWTTVSMVAQGLWNSVMWGGWVVMRAVVLMGSIYNGVLIAIGIAQYILTGATSSTEAALFLFKLQVIATTTWLRIMTGAQWLLNIAMDANPVGAIILGFTILALVIYELYQHYHNLKQAIMDGIALAYIWVFPFIGAALLVISHWDLVKGWFVTFFGWLSTAWGAVAGAATAAWNWVESVAIQAWDSIVNQIRGAVNWIINGLNWVIHKINWATGAYNQVFGWATGNVPVIPDIPTLARGGDIMQAGMALVGERGPEALFLPQGAQVQPLSRLDRNIDRKRVGAPKLQALIPISIDGNQIAQYTADIILTTQAGMGAA
jgi:tape measure domain-containing protein